MLIAGCAGEVTSRPSHEMGGMADRADVTQEQARHLVAKYRQQASDLRMLAQRSEGEARWYVGQFGADDQEGIRRQAQAQQLWAAAEKADRLARDYRRQVLHGQMY
jgi:hypothetical protein